MVSENDLLGGDKKGNGPGTQREMMTRDGHVSAPCPWVSLEERVRVGDIKAKSRHRGRKKEGSNPLFGREASLRHPIACLTSANNMN